MPKKGNYEYIKKLVIRTNYFKEKEEMLHKNRSWQKIKLIEDSIIKEMNQKLEKE